MRGKPVIKEIQREHFTRRTLILDSALDDATIFEEVISEATSLLLETRSNARSMVLLLLARQAQQLRAAQSGSRPARRLLRYFSSVIQKTNSLTSLLKAISNLLARDKKS